MELGGGGRARLGGWDEGVGLHPWGVSLSMGAGEERGGRRPMFRLCDTGLGKRENSRRQCALPMALSLLLCFIQTVSERMGCGGPRPGLPKL